MSDPPDDNSIKECLFEVLRNGDTATMTRSKARKICEEKLDCDLSGYKKKIKAWVEEYFENQPAEPSQSKKRKVETYDEDSHSKRQRFDDSVGAPVRWERSEDGGRWCQLGSKKRISVRRYKGRIFVDLREFYLDEKTGRHKPGRKGLSLSPTEFNFIVSHGRDIKSQMDRV